MLDTYHHIYCGYTNDAIRIRLFREIALRRSILREIVHYLEIDHMKETSSDLSDYKNHDY